MQCCFSLYQWEFFLTTLFSVFLKEASVTNKSHFIWKLFKEFSKYFLVGKCSESIAISVHKTWLRDFCIFALSLGSTLQRPPAPLFFAWLCETQGVSESGMHFWQRKIDTRSSTVEYLPHSALLLYVRVGSSFADIIFNIGVNVWLLRVLYSVWNTAIRERLLPHSSHFCDWRSLLNLQLALDACAHPCSQFNCHWGSICGIYLFCCLPPSSWFNLWFTSIYLLVEYSAKMLLGLCRPTLVWLARMT